MLVASCTKRHEGRQNQVEQHLFAFQVSQSKMELNCAWRNKHTRLKTGPLYEENLKNINTRKRGTSQMMHRMRKSLLAIHKDVADFVVLDEQWGFVDIANRGGMHSAIAWEWRPAVGRSPGLDKLLHCENRVILWSVGEDGKLRNRDNLEGQEEVKVQREV